jgi:hypothetical protein
MQIASLEILHAQATTYLSFVVAGGGASLGFSINQLASPSDPSLTAAVFTLSSYLFIIAGLTVRTCLWSEPVMPTSNRPEHLYQQEFTVAAIKCEELKNLAKSCASNGLLVERVARRLNQMRSLGFLSPAVFLAAWFWPINWALDISQCGIESLHGRQAQTYRPPAHPHLSDQAGCGEQAEAGCAAKASAQSSG